jgi:hypothetical protein
MVPQVRVWLLDADLGFEYESAKPAGRRRYL